MKLTQRTTGRGTGEGRLQAEASWKVVTAFQEEDDESQDEVKQSVERKDRMDIVSLLLVSPSCLILRNLVRQARPYQLF
jgi:hypothetical protein